MALSPGNFVNMMSFEPLDTTIPQVIHHLQQYPIKDVSVGCEHVVALDQQSNVWTWGINTDGQLGNGTNNPNYVATIIRHGDQGKLCRVSSGVFFFSFWYSVSYELLFTT